MPERRWMRVALGLFLLLATACVFALVFLVARSPAVFTSREPYVIRFDDARGVGPGTPVRRSGVRVGEVEAVELGDDGSVRVRVRLDSRYPPRADEQMVINRNLISGDAVIDMEPQPAQPGQPPTVRAVVPPGTELPGKNPTDARDLLAQAGVMLPSAQESLAAIRRSTDRLEKLSPLLEDALREFSAASRAAREFVPELRQTNDRLQKPIRSVGELADDLKRASGDLQAILREWNDISQRVRVSVAANEPKVTAIIDQLARLFGEDNVKRINDTVRFLRDVSEQAAKVFSPQNEQNITATLKNTREFTEALNRVLDEPNQQALRDTLRNLRESTDRLNKVLGDDNQKNLSEGLRYTRDAVEQLSKFLNEQNRREFDSTLTNVRQITDDLKPAAKASEEVVRETNKTLRRLQQSLTELDSVARGVRSLTDPLAPRAPQITKNVEELTDQLNRGVAEVRELLRVLAREDGTLQKVLTDPSLYNNLNGVIAGVPRLLESVERVLKDAEVFADKLARHPELIGVRGAIKPDSGIKEPPPQVPTFHGRPGVFQR